jgi:hypothetical protein
MAQEQQPDRAEEAPAPAGLLAASACVVLGVLVAVDHLAEVPGALAAYAAAAWVVRR